VTVRLFILRIFFQGFLKAQGEERLDVDDVVRLRELLVEWADRHNPGSGKVRDYAEWRLDVHRIEEARTDRRGPRVARVSVDSAGRTVVERR